MKIKTYDKCIITADEIDEVLSYRDVSFRKVSEFACRYAIMMAGRTSPLPKELNAGIAFFTKQGENFPKIWRDTMTARRKLRPLQFLSSINNSAAGFCAIQLGLIGPQITLVSGDIELAARVQLAIGRSRFMLVCKAEQGGAAECFVLEVKE